MYNIYNNLSLQTIWSGTDELTLCCHKYTLTNQLEFERLVVVTLFFGKPTTMNRGTIFLQGLRIEAVRAI